MVMTFSNPAGKTRRMECPCQSAATFLEEGVGAVGMTEAAASDRGLGMKDAGNIDLAVRCGAGLYRL